jgi:DNA repair exonuclease SbcCD ATPase subunit
MKEVGVKLKNIGVFREVREFKLSSGLNIIYAPNASGKSSLIAGLKAISVPVLSKQEIARILNDYEDRGFVALSINDKEYVTELIRISPMEVEVLGERLSSDGVVRIISFLDLENPLVNAIYGGDEERLKQILREVSGVSYIETIVSVLNGLKAEYEHQYEIKSREYEARKSEIETELSRVEMELRKIDERINEILRDTRIEPAKREIERIEMEKKELEILESKKRSEEIELRNRLSSIDIDQRKSKAELEILKEKYSKLLAEKELLSSRIIEYRRKIEELEVKIKSLKDEKEKIGRELKELDSLLRRREIVVTYDYCLYCGARIDKDKLYEGINQIRTRISELRDKMTSIDNEIISLESEKNGLRKQGEERLHVVEDELRKLEPQISELQNMIDSYNRVRNEIERKLEIIEAEIKAIRDRFDTLIRQLESFKEIPLVKELRARYEERSRLAEARDRLYGRLKQIEQLYSDVVKLKEVISKANLLVEYFNIRLIELGRIVVEKINEVVSKHFRLLRLAELEYPVFAERFELRLTRKGGVATTLAELSDAEKAILAILLTLALKEYVAEDFPFYVIDSLIEFIDDARTKEVLEYLMEFANNSNIVLVVTKTKPYAGEPRLLTQEDILSNQIVV